MFQGPKQLMRAKSNSMIAMQRYNTLKNLLTTLAYLAIGLCALTMIFCILNIVELAELSKLMNVASHYYDESIIDTSTKVEIARYTAKIIFEFIATVMGVISAIFLFYSANHYQSKVFEIYTEIENQEDRKNN